MMEQHMEHISLINRIIEAESKAQQIADEAKEKRGHLQESLQSAKDSVRRTYMERAQKRIDMIQKREDDMANDALAELDARFEKDKAQVERHYAANKDAWVDRLFNSIIGK